MINTCTSLGVPVIAGGPTFTAGHEEFEDVAHFVLNEAELTLPEFLKDIENGLARRIYRSEKDTRSTSDRVCQLPSAGTSTGRAALHE